MKSKHLLLLLLILIIAGFLRLYQITTTPPGLYPDEAIGGNQGLQALRTFRQSADGGGFKLFYPENNGRSGLFINLQGLSAGVLGATSPSQISQGEISEGKPWTLRFPSAILGILTVLALYFLAKELFEDAIPFSPKPRSQPGLVSDLQSDQAGEDKRVSRWSERSGLRKNEIVALLSAFLLATSFWHINFSRIGFDGIMAPFFLVWSVYFLLKAFHSKSPTSCKLYAICSGLFYGLGFHSYIAYRVTPVLILFILIYYWRKSKKENWRRQFLISISYFLLFTFVAALPIGIYFLTHPADFSQRASEISVFSSKMPLKDLGLNIVKTLGMFNFRGDGNWRHNYPGKSELFWPVSVLFIFGIIVGIKSIASTKHETLNPTIGSEKRIKTKESLLSSSEPIDEASLHQQISNPNGSNPKRFRIWSLINCNLFRNSNLGFSILFLWFALGAAPAVFSNDGIPHALRSILMAPPVFMFAGVGGIAAYDFLKRRITSFWLPVASAIFLLLFTFEAYNTYFVLWARNPNTYGAFSADYVELGRTLNELPANVPKYVIVKAGGVLVNGPPAMTSSGEVGRGIPMPAQTVMFITDTYSTENQKNKNIHYVLPNQENTIPSSSLKFYLN